MLGLRWLGAGASESRNTILNLFTYVIFVCVDAGSPEYEQDKDGQDDDEKRSDDEGDESRAEKRPHSDDEANDSDRASKRSRSDVDDADNANSKHSGSDSEIFGSDEDWFWLWLTDWDLAETADMIRLMKIM